MAIWSLPFTGGLRWCVDVAHVQMHIYVDGFSQRKEGQRYDPISILSSCKLAYHVFRARLTADSVTRIGWSYVNHPDLDLGERRSVVRGTVVNK